MARLKVGRNELCPCGSGKKYKKCCGMLDELIDAHDDAFTRNSKLMTAVKMKLDNYYGNTIKKIRKDAKQQFLRFTVNKSLPEEHESLYSDWIWFDILTENNNTLTNHYLTENANYIATSLRDCLGAFSMSFLSVYEVEEIRGHYLSVRDIFLEQTYDILLKEPWEGVNKDTNLLLLGRQVLVEDESLFSGMVLAVENTAGQKDFLIEHMNFIQQVLDDTMVNVLKFHAEMLYGVFDHAYYKTLVNFNEIRGLEITPEDSTMLHKALADDEDFIFLHHSEGFSWFKPARQHQSYVRLILGEKELLYCADVLEDILNLQVKLTALLPGKKFTVYSNRFLQQPPLPAKNQLWFMVLKDQETERWLDTAMVELEDKTPRELLPSDTGKERLLSMLDNFMTTRENDSENELIEYMKERVINYMG